MSDKKTGPNLVKKVVEILVALHGVSFANRSSGKYRISRKYLRQISMKRKLTAEFIDAITDEIFEEGYVLIDLETHFVVLKQSLFNSYRRVTDRAISLVTSMNGNGEMVIAEPEDGDVETSNSTH